LARTRLFELIATPNGALRAPHAHRSFAASYSTPKNIYNLLPPPARVFSFHWTTEAMKYEGPCPSKLCTDATIRPNFFGLFFFYSFGPFLFVILFFFFSPFKFLLILLFLSLLILLVGAILRLLMLLFLYFNCLLYYRHA
jgi:cellulose synthase/poly-beta-1,6-N-acetylglucosamine synthase-like glycosyltransferase